MAGLPKAIVFLAASMLIAGCGGGSGTGSTGFSIGSSSSTSTTPTSSTSTTSTTSTTLPPDSGRGLYEGMASNGRYFNTLVLDDDRYYIVYGVLVNADFIVDGLMSGSGVSGAGGFTSSDLRDFPAGGTVFLGSMNAAYIPATRFDAVVSRSGQAIGFDGSVPPPGRYRYDVPAQLADVAGAWNLRDLRGTVFALNLQPDGNFTGASGGCSISGKLAPRPGGSNVFDARIDFGPAPCVQAGQSATGQAVSYLRENGARQLLFAATDAGRTLATVLAGVR